MKVSKKMLKKVLKKNEEIFITSYTYRIKFDKDKVEFIDGKMKVIMNGAISLFDTTNDVTFNSLKKLTQGEAYFMCNGTLGIINIKGDFKDE